MLPYSPPSFKVFGIAPCLKPCRTPPPSPPQEVFDFPLLKAFMARKDFSLVFDAMHAVTGPYAQRILVQVWDGGGLRRGGVCVCVCAK